MPKLTKQAMSKSIRRAKAAIQDQPLNQVMLQDLLYWIGEARIALAHGLVELEDSADPGRTQEDSFTMQRMRWLLSILPESMENSS
jgi:hypothetical protein